MKQSERPMWKKSMLQSLSYSDIINYLWEIGDNGDPYGYEREEGGYYQEYKEQFDELSDTAYQLVDQLQECDVRENWDDMVVALLGETHTVLGFNTIEADYFKMLNSYCEDCAIEEAEKRLGRLTKRDLIRTWRKVMTIMVLFFDIKAAHDCLTSIVEELDERGALHASKSKQIDRLFEDLTVGNNEKFDDIAARLPQRMWIE